jgi:predicted nucleic acid-binding protein
MSSLVYVETSIPSFYYETRQETRFQAMREWTREWWDAARLRDTLVTSEAVFLELERAPEPKRSEAVLLMKPLQVLDSGPDVDVIVEAYIAHKLMPRDALGDARHLALATYYRCDILATWNCRHIANANKLAHIRQVNFALGMETPLLVTPFELLEKSP